MIKEIQEQEIVYWSLDSYKSLNQTQQQKELRKWEKEVITLAWILTEPPQITTTNPVVVISVQK